MWLNENLGKVKREAIAAASFLAAGLAVVYQCMGQRSCCMCGVP